MATQPVTLVVPLYNEAHRWNHHYWERLLSLDGISWLFVDDGSSDLTSELVESLRGPHNVDMLTLPQNQGKANAVRAGLKQALGTGSVGVGFLDGDGAFDQSDVVRLVSIFLSRCHARDELSRKIKACESVWASRVALAGHDIQRRASRHYIGRVIATMISPGLPDVPYDTQCGFKIFKTSPELVGCLTKPFVTRWFFDVELLQRWIAATGEPLKVWEVPLLHWRDVPGSKITSRNAIQISRELAYVRQQNRRLHR